MEKKRRPIPAFKSEAQERAFWESHDSSGYVDWSQAERIRLANLKPSTQTISLRLPVALLEQIKIAAHKRGVPYQSLMKVWLSEKLETRSAPVHPSVRKGTARRTVTFSSFLRRRLRSARRQNRNNLLILMTRPRFRRSQPRSGRKPPVTSRSSV